MLLPIPFLSFTALDAFQSVNMKTSSIIVSIFAASAAAAPAGVVRVAQHGDGDLAAASQPGVNQAAANPGALDALLSVRTISV